MQLDADKDDKDSDRWREREIDVEGKEKRGELNVRVAVKHAGHRGYKGGLVACAREP